MKKSISLLFAAISCLCFKYGGKIAFTGAACGVHAAAHAQGIPSWGICATDTLLRANIIKAGVNACTAEYGASMDNKRNLFRFLTKAVRIDTLNNTRDDGAPDNFIWASSNGTLLRSPKTSLLWPSSQIQESDPTVDPSVKMITSQDVADWTTAFGWGDHAGLYPTLLGSYNNPPWVNTLSFAKLTTFPGASTDYLTGDGGFANFPTNVSAFTNDANYITAASLSGYVQGTRTISTTSPLSGGGDLSANRTLSIADAAADGSTKGAASFTAADFNASSGNISIDYTNGQAASGSNNGFLASGDWTLFNNAATRSFNNTPSHSIVTVAAAANGFQLSSTRDAEVNYSVRIVCTVQIGVITNVEGYVVLEIAPTNSTTAGDWVEIGRSANGQNIGLAIALSSTQTSGGQIGGTVPAGYYTRLRSVNVAGTPTYAYMSGQEVLK